MKRTYKHDKAFTFVELLIVVTILGILAAVVLPTLQDSTQKAKEAAAKDNLRILRNAIELYANDHDGIPPGYINDNTSSTPSYMAFERQMTELEQRLSAVPENPLNNITVMKVLANSDSFPEVPADTTQYGWIYQPAIKKIKLNYPSTDSDGIAYFDY
ncbi:MAG: type II secretion system GspH family protein [Anaerohalosphaeraceae bacterium]|nr:type II secretion system GspH family protein [Anaerohalosphaeraceae bacterium]